MFEKQRDDAVQAFSDVTLTFEPELMLCLQNSSGKKESDRCT